MEEEEPTMTVHSTNIIEFQFRVMSLLNKNHTSPCHRLTMPQRPSIRTGRSHPTPSIQVPHSEPIQVMLASKPRGNEFFPNEFASVCLFGCGAMSGQKKPPKKTQRFGLLGVSAMVGFQTTLVFVCLCLPWSHEISPNQSVFI